MFWFWQKKKRVVWKGVKRNPGLLLPHSSPLSTSTCSWRVTTSVSESGSVALQCYITQDHFLPVLPFYFYIQLLGFSTRLPAWPISTLLISSQVLCFFYVKSFVCFPVVMHRFLWEIREYRWTSLLLLCCHYGNL